MVVGQGLSLTAIGLAVGIPSAFLATRVLRSLLFGVSASDPETFASVAIFLGGVAVVASYLPARRASRIDPLVALRSE
jgi:putative ABC transport system permease protein